MKRCQSPVNAVLVLDKCMQDQQYLSFPKNKWSFVYLRGILKFENYLIRQKVEVVKISQNFGKIFQNLAKFIRIRQKFIKIRRNSSKFVKIRQNLLNLSKN